MFDDDEIFPFDYYKENDSEKNDVSCNDKSQFDDISPSPNKIKAETISNNEKIVEVKVKLDNKSFNNASNKNDCKAEIDDWWNEDDKQKVKDNRNKRETQNTKYDNKPRNSIKDKSINNTWHNQNWKNNSKHYEINKHYEIKPNQNKNRSKYDSPLKNDFHDYKKINKHKEYKSTTPIKGNHQYNKANKNKPDSSYDYNIQYDKNGGNTTKQNSKYTNKSPDYIKNNNNFYNKTSEKPYYSPNTKPMFQTIKYKLDDNYKHEHETRSKSSLQNNHIHQRYDNISKSPLKKYDDRSKSPIDYNNNYNIMNKNNAFLSINPFPSENNSQNKRENSTNSHISNKQYNKPLVRSNSNIDLSNNKYNKSKNENSNIFLEKEQENKIFFESKFGKPVDMRKATRSPFRNPVEEKINQLQRKNKNEIVDLYLELDSKYKDILNKFTAIQNELIEQKSYLNKKREKDTKDNKLSKSPCRRLISSSPEEDRYEIENKRFSNSVIQKKDKKLIINHSSPKHTKEVDFGLMKQIATPIKNNLKDIVDDSKINNIEEEIIKHTPQNKVFKPIVEITSPEFYALEGIETSPIKESIDVDNKILNKSKTKLTKKEKLELKLEKESNHLKEIKLKNQLKEAILKKEAQENLELHEKNLKITKEKVKKIEEPKTNINLLNQVPISPEKTNKKDDKFKLLKHTPIRTPKKDIFSQIPNYNKILQICGSNLTDKEKFEKYKEIWPKEEKRLEKIISKRIKKLSKGKTIKEKNHTLKEYSIQLKETASGIEVGYITKDDN